MAIHNAHMYERDLIGKFLEALRELPDVDVHSSIPELQRNHRVDAAVEIGFAGKSYVLLVDLKKSVYPRDAQHILWHGGISLLMKAPNTVRTNLCRYWRPNRFRRV